MANSGSCASTGCFIMAAMIITGPLVGVYVVKPAFDVYHFKEAMCTNQRFEYAGKEKTCSCGEHCSSSYPCYQVFVDYEDRENELTHQGAYVLEDEQTLVHRDDCTFTLASGCRNSKSKNKEKVEEELQEKGYPFQTYTCYYDPDNPNVAIIKKKFTLAGAINALFWPSFLFLLGCGCLLCSVKEKWDCSSSSSGGGTRNRTRSTPSSTREGQQTDDNISEVSVTTVGQLSDRITTNGTGEDKPPNYNDAVQLPEDPYAATAPPSYDEATNL
ncbi:calcium-activated potassium channel subunit beta-3-like [Oscarella lobularis]|uniref:calcium-activated potassium channel subunit beta-3-like n=1 Tax=Oscarella lobularis TaxID=121494 RepID=UPI003313F8B7